MGCKMDPRLRDSRLLAPSGHGRGREFTQPREHLIALLSTKPEKNIYAASVFSLYISSPFFRDLERRFPQGGRGLQSPQPFSRHRQKVRCKVEKTKRDMATGGRVGKARFQK